MPFILGLIFMIEKHEVLFLTRCLKMGLVLKVIELIQILPQDVPNCKAATNFKEKVNPILNNAKC